MSVWSRCARASRPDVAGMRFSPSSLEDHFITEQLRGLIIHHEDVDLVVRIHGSPRSLPGRPGTSAVTRGRLRCARTGARCAVHPADGTVAASRLGSEGTAGARLQVSASRTVAYHMAL